MRLSFLIARGSEQLVGLLAFLLVFVFLGLPAPAHAEGDEAHGEEAKPADLERIIRFDVRAVVQRDGGLQITEAIHVFATNEAIRHGIFRDLSTNRKNPSGVETRERLEILEVLRDGEEETKRLEEIPGGTRIYLGDKESIVVPGAHTYTLQYEIDGRVEFGERSDTFAWNVTGQRWAFPIDEVELSFQLPPGSDVSRASLKGVTGAAGVPGSHDVEISGASLHLKSNRVLSPGEGFSATLSLPKGVVSAPSGEKKREDFYDQHGGDFFVGLLFVFTGAYLWLAWALFGRDPTAQAPVLSEEPPEGHSPGAIRYVKRMRYDSRCFTADVLQLAVDGHLRVIRRGDTYELRKIESGSFRQSWASDLKQSLFRRGAFLLIERKNQEVIRDARTAHKKELKRVYLPSHFRNNRWLLVPAWLGVPVAALYLLAPGASLLGFFIFVLLLALNWGFVRWMRRRTRVGQELMDGAGNFEAFLEREGASGGESSAHSLERFLPYAVALGIAREGSGAGSVISSALRSKSVVEATPWFLGELPEGDDLALSVADALSSSFDSAMGASGGDGGGGGDGGSGGGGW